MRVAALLAAALAGTANDGWIDRHIEFRLEGVTPSPLCDEPEFLRRVSLDLAGVVPTMSEARAYLARPDRRKLVDRLLESDEFSARWARFLLELTAESRAISFGNQDFNGHAYYGWLVRQIHERRPYDRIVRDIIGAKGGYEEAPEVQFLIRWRVIGLGDLTSHLGKAILGTRLRCAQCHDHPYQRISQEDFWGVAAFFTRTREYANTDDGLPGITEVKQPFKIRLPSQELPKEGAPPPEPVAIEPRWLGASGPASGAGRAELAKSLAADPLFAKNIVNRLWAELMGRGLQEPLDGFGGKTKPSHPRLLDELAGHFIQSGYDLRATLRLIAMSKAYQRSCRSDGMEPALFAHAALRPLSVDQLYLSLNRATVVQEPSAPRLDAGSGKANAKEMMMADRNAASSADALYADRWPRQLLGDVPGASTAGRLAMFNRREIQKLIDAGVHAALKAMGPNVGEDHFEYITLALLSRPLSKSERKRVEGKKDTADLRDFFWAAVNSIEFRYNH